ncbi:hypothetical protein EU527_17245 [Candidatus Thorarchaeota archaeon]|nr:MAG: hypothetical protein EU527_17245 [Candidatus Thorarchaeota archaeon]
MIVNKKTAVKESTTMTTCEECKRFGYIRTDQVSYPCALCGELRCEDHMIWVPAHELLRPLDEAETILRLLVHDKIGGWYGFCGRASHIPRGLPIRYGKGKEGGKVVEAILDNQKKSGLESFKFWEVGTIEEGYEKVWEIKRYALSCSLAPVMALIANMYSTGQEPTMFLENLHSSAFMTFAAKKLVYYGEDWKKFTKTVGTNPRIEDLIRYTCSRCSVIPCMNRQAPFYDAKLLRNLIRLPEVSD